MKQGITTIIGGNCGSSLAPLINDEAIKSIQKYADISKAQVHWSSFGEFLSFLDGLKFSPNFGSLVGHSTLRRALVGDEVRELKKDEIQLMIGGLDNALREGALGLSTGLVYSHARAAAKAEIKELAKVVKKYEGVYTTHLRQEGENLLESIREAISVAEETGVNLQISHLKACGEKSWPLMDKALDLIERARSGGLAVNYDVYPYIEAGSVLYTLLPAWVAEGGKDALIKRLKEEATRKKVIEEMNENDLDYGEIVIAYSKLGGRLQRRKIAEIAKNQERDAEEIVLDLILASDDKITTIVELMHPKNVEKAIVREYSIVSSNGAGYSKDYKKSGNLVHPRCFGAIPKYLREYVLEKEALTLEQAIEKITRVPAEKFGLGKEIGTLEEGKRADVAIFDPKLIQGRATVENPFQYAEGVREVLVGGELIVEGGKLTGKRTGAIFEK